MRAVVGFLFALWVATPAAAWAQVSVVEGVAQDFSRNCQGCHRADGLGACGAVPRAKDFVGLFTRIPEGREYLLRVPGVVWAMLDDERLADVLNWMLRTYSPNELAPDFRPFTKEEVKEARKRPLANVLEVRSRLIARMQKEGLIPPGEDGFNSAKCGR